MQFNAGIFHKKCLQVLERTTRKMPEDIACGWDAKNTVVFPVKLQSIADLRVTAELALQVFNGFGRKVVQVEHHQSIEGVVEFRVEVET